jgi:ANTAR domain
MTDSDVEEWQSAIDIVLRRFAGYHDREGAFGRRAVTERAKGILIERHSVDDADAFEMLRDQSRRTNTYLAEVAAAVVDGHRLLPRQPDVSTPRARPTGGYSSLRVTRQIGSPLCLVSLGAHDVGARDAPSQLALSASPTNSRDAFSIGVFDPGTLVVSLTTVPSAPGRPPHRLRWRRPRCEHDRGRWTKSSVDVTRPKFAGLTNNQPRRGGSCRVSPRCRNGCPRGRGGTSAT